ncbi:PEGA domain-containing protein [Comamonas sp. JC664]|uniref:PEGA domain-containing protein n=1 Tax=Comamonas sp. JC664 TaxID=2801917 RepID=UPI00174C6D15|nr:PEGA domain-containing protein [Comamonas sp. JC664]
MTTFRRTSLLLAFVLATSPAYGQSSRKRTSKKKPAATQPVKTTKAPPDDDSDDDAPRAFGTPEEEAATQVPPLVTSDAPARSAPPPALKTEATATSPVTATGPLALFTVARMPALEDAARKLEDDLLRQLKAGGGVELVDLSVVFPPAPPASLARADTLFEQGRSDYDNLDPESAEAKFLAAAEAYTQHPAELNTERLANAYLFLGASRMLNGDSAAALDAFRRAVVAEPSTTPDAALFGQDVMKSYEQARAEVKARPAGTLVVESKPPGASVALRGRELGVTPLSGVEVPAGQHPVVVTLPGHASFAQYTDVASSKSTEVKATLEPTPGLAAVRDAASHAATEQAFERSTPPPETLAIAERLDARYVVIAAVSRGEKGRMQADLQAWDVRTQARLRGVQISLAPGEKKLTPAAAADQVRAFVNGVTVPRAAEGNTFSTIIKRPWFWAVVGGAAAVTAGAVFMATSQDKGRPYNPVSGGIGF